jgi:hypothetical protein
VNVAVPELGVAVPTVGVIVTIPAFVGPVMVMARFLAAAASLACPKDSRNVPTTSMRRERDFGRVNCLIV